MSVLELKYRLHSCPVCTSNNFEILNKRQEDVMINDGVCRFKIVEGICKNCGFIFTNPYPDQESLLEYYKKKNLHSVGKPDYNLNNRLNYLKKIKNSFSSLLEIGSGEGSFLRSAAELGFEVTGFEPIDAAGSLQHTYKKMPERKYYEIIVVNHVLEHIPDPLEFLKNLRTFTKDGGLLLVEVPNIHLYDLYSSAIFYEHLSHFSPSNLSYLIRKAGFEPIEFEFSKTSRPIGFSILSKKSDEITSQSQPQEFETNKTYFLKALTLFDERDVRYRLLIKNSLEKSGERKIALWGANQFMYRILELISKEKFDKIVLVDENKNRWNQQFSDKHSLPILNPETLLNNTEISVVLICAVDWEKEIRNCLKNMGYNDEQIIKLPI